MTHRTVHKRKRPKPHTFRVILEDDRFEDGTKAYHVFVPALSGCHSWGFSHEEAMRAIEEAAQIYVEDLLASREPVPVDTDIGVSFLGPKVTVRA